MIVWFTNIISNIIGPIEPQEARSNSMALNVAHRDLKGDMVLSEWATEKKSLYYIL
jgi:hypothetical protein